MKHCLGMSNTKFKIVFTSGGGVRETCLEGVYRQFLQVGLCFIS